MLLAFLLPFAALAEDAATSILQYEAESSGASSFDAWARDVLPGTMGIGGEWYALALHQRGYDLPGCLDVLDDYLASHKVRSATSRLKFQFVRMALGGALPDNWHADIGAQGVMSWAWGLHLLNNGALAPVTADAVIAELLALQLTDGGWANSGNRADADVTAMVLQSLAPHKDQPDAAQAIDRALICLDELQLPDGSYASYGVACPESASQVAIAKAALGLDASDLLAVLDAFRLESGGYSHTLGGAENATATMQVFLAHTALQRQADGLSPLYVLDAAHPGEMKASLGWKGIAAIAIAAAGVLAVGVMRLLGKRHPRNLLAIALGMGLALAAVYFLDIQPADDYYTVAAKQNAIGTVTVSIRCDTVAGRAAHIPADGVILPPTPMPIAAGDTAFTVLTDAARAHGVLIESSGGYITGIANLFEFDYGALSGWIFLINGEEASQGSDQISLKSGDAVEWRYTLELGRDLE